MHPFCGLALMGGSISIARLVGTGAGVDSKGMGVSTGLVGLTGGVVQVGRGARTNSLSPARAPASRALTCPSLGESGEEIGEPRTNAKRTNDRRPRRSLGKAAMVPSRQL